MAEEQLFEAFPPQDLAAWEAIIRKELKGADPASLEVRLGEGLKLAPYHIGGSASAPGYRRGVKRSGDPWRMTILVNTGDPHPATNVNSRGPKSRAGLIA